jgi:hypothetical protein
VDLRHLEWWIREPVPDPDMVLYEVGPYLPAQADRIIEQLCVLAGLDVGQAGDHPERGERVRQAFRVDRRGRPRATGRCSICGRSSARSGGRHGATC